METAFVNTPGTLADKLMAALQGAKRPGADSRCLDFGISSASAFIRVADPSDTDSSYGNLSLDLNVWITGEVFEPIDALQELYDGSLGIADNQLSKGISIVPNPARETVTIKSEQMIVTGYQIMDVSGKVIAKRTVSIPSNNVYLDVQGYTKGLYFINIIENDKIVASKKLIIN